MTPDELAALLKKLDPPRAQPAAAEAEPVTYVSMRRAR